MTIRLEEIVYLHCHQQGTVIPSYLFEVAGVGVLKVIYLVMYCINLSSEQWWDCGFGEPGWDPETSSTFPQRRPPPPVSHLPGDRPATSWTAGPTTLESERKGQHEQRMIKYFCSLLFSIVDKIMLY